MIQYFPSINNKSNFLFDSSDAYIYNILTDNKWLPITKNTSRFCKLKWLCSPSAQDYNSTEDDQFINHFKNNHHLTTKIGLMKTLSSYHPDGEKHFLKFYPRSYDLKQDFQLFLKDFENTAILNLLKKMIIHFQITAPTLFRTIRQFTLKNKILDSTTFLQHLIETNSFFVNQPTSISLTFHKRSFLHLLLYLDHSISLKNWSIQKIDTDLLVEYSKEEVPYQDQSEEMKVPSFESLCLLIHYYRCYKNRLKWFLSDGVNNVWVVKGNQSSRGRSISLVNTIGEAKQLNNGTRIIQKYVQNIWVLQDQVNLSKYPQLQKMFLKKFDIRVWVFVRSFSPLISYIYKEGYLRISSHPYQVHSLHDHLIHLTNYSINANHIPKNQSYILLTHFDHFIRGQYKHYTLFSDIKAIIQTAIKSANVSHKENQFQLFGFDIILDSDLKPWLLECNMSPACDERGQLKQVLHQMGQGILSLMGFINQPTTLWQQLTKAQSKKMVSQQKIDETNLLKNNTKLVVNGSNFNISKYLLKEQLQVSLQKVAYIQRYFKQRYKNTRNHLWSKQQKRVSRVKIMIVYLAKTITKAKKAHLRILIKKIKKIRKSQII